MMFKKYNSVRWLVHILFWVVYFCIMVLPGFFNKGGNAQLYYVVQFVILIVATYVNVLWLIRKYFVSEQYMKYFTGLFFVWLFGLVATYSSWLLFDYPNIAGKLLRFVLATMIVFSLQFFLINIYKLAKEWYLKSQRTKELEFEKIRAELNLLRTQLDAHFIFNTLNNMYLLVLNKSDKAPDALLMLSDLLSYTIYETHADRVELSKELNFIDNYIHLQKLRLDSKQKVKYVMSGDTIGDIEPLILFNFIENSFKHAQGLVVVDGEECFIYINIEINEQELILKTINGKVPDSNNEGNDKCGLGINNAMKRLELAYADNYKLDIDDRGSEYHLTLIISRHD